MTLAAANVETRLAQARRDVRGVSEAEAREMLVELRADALGKLSRLEVLRRFEPETDQGRSRVRVHEVAGALASFVRDLERLLAPIEGDAR